MNFLLISSLKYAHKRQNNKKSTRWGALRTITDHFRRLKVIVGASPKKFIGVKLYETVFITGLDKYIGIVCIARKRF